ncbi:hypothetical protein AcW1_006807 [Taiwanofungus camphoratus]|nr:hypothetical protein AcW2_005571 [Antrodia cinnamomea]KAI0953839.1 hypothetical protein AcV7_007258 [Antrodia cinnamomea]KAI0955136.1 hypothetical protein AcW1_006807 [Antrodia cinnamomea]
MCISHLSLFPFDPQSLTASHSIPQASAIMLCLIISVEYLHSGSASQRPRPYDRIAPLQTAREVFASSIHTIANSSNTNLSRVLGTTVRRDRHLSFLALWEFRATAQSSLPSHSASHVAWPKKPSLHP